MKKRKWNPGDMEAEVKAIADAIGHFPSNSELKSMGRGDLANQIAKGGGFISVSERVGVSRQHSDSDTGWEGEIAFCQWAMERGFRTERTLGIKAPFDILLGGVLRVDVKTANYAEYGPCRGWFYRIGKIPQADIIVCVQLDTGDFYGLPWMVCPKSNVTISREGGKYRQFKNNWSLVSEMIATRKAERERWCEQVA